MLICMAALLASAAQAAPANEIAIPRPRAFSESVSATRGGELFVGSVGDGTVWHARPGDAAATVWLEGAAAGIPSMLGVFADERAGTLWICSRPAPDGTEAERERASALVAVDLRTRAPKGRWPLPNGAKAVCNDMAVARDGTLYVAETAGGRVLRLRKGGAALEVWLEDPRLAGVDGIAFDADGTLYLSTVGTSRAFRVAIGRDGRDGGLAELTPSRPMDHPDGLRFLAPGRFLIGENGDGGGITLARVAGDRLELTKLEGSLPGTTSAVAIGKRAYGVVAKLRYRAPAMAGQDPGPFAVYSVPLP